MYASEMQYQVLREHLFRRIEEGDIGTYRVTVVVGIPVLLRLTRHARAVAVERIAHIHVDRLAEAL